MFSGRYVFKQNGEIIGEGTNSFTQNGVYMVNQYLAQAAQDWAGMFVFGAKPNAGEVYAYDELYYEISRTPVTIKDTISGSIVLKGTVDPGLTARIYQIGLVAENNTTISGPHNFYLSNFSELYGTSGYSDWAVGSSVATASNTMTPISSYTVGLTNETLYSRTGKYMIKWNPASDGNYLTRDGFNLALPKYNKYDSIWILYDGQSALVPTGSMSVTLTDSSGNQWSTASVAVLNYLPYTAELGFTSDPPANFDYILDRITIWSDVNDEDFVIHDIKFMTGKALTPEESLVSVRTVNTAGSLRDTSTPLFIATANQPVDVEYYLTVT